MLFLYKIYGENTSTAEKILKTYAVSQVMIVHKIGNRG
jgi:hypothetical protein